MTSSVALFNQNIWCYQNSVLHLGMHQSS